MEGIGHFEYILGEIFTKVIEREPLSIDDKIDFYLALYSMDIYRSDHEQDPDKMQKYLLRANENYMKLRKMEKRNGMR